MLTGACSCAAFVRESLVITHSTTCKIWAYRAELGNTKTRAREDAQSFMLDWSILDKDKVLSPAILGQVRKGKLEKL